MATKKAAKKKAARKNGGSEQWTVDEKKIFDEFGIGWGDESTRRLIRGQRRLNKRFYETLEVILDRLPRIKINKSGRDEELERVIELNKGVPGESPGCGG